MKNAQKEVTLEEVINIVKDNKSFIESRFINAWKRRGVGFEILQILWEINTTSTWIMIIILGFGFNESLQKRS